MQLRKKWTFMLIFAVTGVLLGIITAAAKTSEPVNLTWQYNNWWFQQTEDFFGTFNENPGAKFAFSDQKLDGSRSFEYKLTFTADVTDKNVQSFGWDKLDLYLGLQGAPDTNLEGFDYPGFMDGEKQIFYDTLCIRIKRYSDTSATVCRMKNQEEQILGSVQLSPEQRENGHTFNVLVSYTYEDEANQSLTITLDGTELLKITGAKALVNEGRLGFEASHMTLRVMDAELSYLDTAEEKPSPSPSAEPTAKPTAEPGDENVPNTDDSSAIILAMIVIFAACTAAGSAAYSRKTRITR